jgi:hypothetical protein
LLANYIYVMRLSVGQLRAIIKEELQEQSNKQLLREFVAQNKEDEFVMQLFTKFPIAPGFDAQTVMRWVTSLLRSFGQSALDLVTIPQVWMQKIQAHNRGQLPSQDVKKLATVITKALGS